MEDDKISSMEDWRLIYEQGAKNLLTYLFLKNFHEKFTKLLDTISLYLSQYEMFDTYYLTNTHLQVVREIKTNLLSTIYILNSMNLEPTLKSRVQRVIEETRRDNQQGRVQQTRFGILVGASFLHPRQQFLERHIKSCSNSYKKDSG